MNDRELADAVVALGVGAKGTQLEDGFWALDPEMYDDINEAYMLKSADFVSDWRVAGSLMERLAKSKDPDTNTVALSFGPDIFCASTSATPTYGVYLERPDKSAPRAIIEACVASLATAENNQD